MSAQLTHHHAYHYGNGCLLTALELPELAELPSRPALPVPALRIVRTLRPPAPPAAGPVRQHVWNDSDGNACILGERWGDGRYRLEFPDTATAVITSDGHDIQLHADAEIDAVTLRHVLLDQILPRVLSLHEPLVLHGAAVVTRTARTVVVLGKSGMGKSTLSAGFERFGAGALGDDGVIVQFDGNASRVLPTYPGYRLWPDSFDELFPERADHGLPFASGSSKRRLQPAGEHPRTPASPIAGIAILSEETDDTCAISLQPMTASDACMALIANSFVIDPNNPAHMARQLATAARLCQNIRVYALQYPRDYTLLPDVVNAVSAAFE